MVFEAERENGTQEGATVTSTLGTLRRRILTPSTSETKLSVRGFAEKTAESRDLLETVGESFLAGYAHAAESSSAPEAEDSLERIPDAFRGFAYEGAGMALAVRDGLPLGHRHHVRDFLGGRAEKHVYMVYVGVGWALARVPRFCWGAATSGATDPLLRWLVHDGYGFHQAYFHTDRYVHQQYHETGFPWPADGPRWYASRAIDQGIGRAMWFVCGTDPESLASTIDKSPESRRPDLYAGAGLAATYAGGVNEEELRLLRDRAGDCRPQLAQGSAFAASARVMAGLVVPHTELASQVLCGLTPGQADALCQESKPTRRDGDVPAYETWRRRVAGGGAPPGRRWR